MNMLVAEKPAVAAEDDDDVTSDDEVMDPSFWDARRNMLPVRSRRCSHIINADEFARPAAAAMHRRRDVMLRTRHLNDCVSGKYATGSGNVSAIFICTTIL